MLKRSGLGLGLGGFLSDFRFRAKIISVCLTGILFQDNEMKNEDKTECVKSSIIKIIMVTSIRV